MNKSVTFDRVVCLSVDKRLKRRPRIIEDTKSLGFNVTFFTAGEGKLLPQNEYDHIDVPLPPHVPKTLRFRLPHAYNAFLCYQKIIRKANEDGIETMLLLEDDVVFMPNFQDVFQCASQELLSTNKQWDLFYLGASHKKGKTMMVGQCLMRVNGSLCFHAVGIRRGMFETLLTLPDTGPIDQTVAKTIQAKKECFACWPNIAIQRPGYSCIGEKYVNNSKHFAHQGKVCQAIEELLC